MKVVVFCLSLLLLTSCTCSSSSVKDAYDILIENSKHTDSPNQFKGTEEVNLGNTTCKNFDYFFDMTLYQEKLNLLMDNKIVNYDDFYLKHLAVFEKCPKNQHQVLRFQLMLNKLKAHAERNKVLWNSFPSNEKMANAYKKSIAYEYWLVKATLVNEPDVKKVERFYRSLKSKKLRDYLLSNNKIHQILIMDKLEQELYAWYKFQMLYLDSYKAENHLQQIEKFYHKYCTGDLIRNAEVEFEKNNKIPDGMLENLYGESILNGTAKKFFFCRTKKFLRIDGFYQNL